MDALKRLRAELRELRRSSAESDIALRADDDNIKRWRAWVRGPPDTPYAGGVFELAIEVKDTYPVAPPIISCVTRIFHPNVHFKTGEICLDILKQEWTPAWGLQSACRAIIALLSDPQADSPLNCDAGNMIRAGDSAAFNSMAAMYTADLAMGSWPDPDE